MTPREIFQYWVRERNHIRVRKEVIEQGAPWTKDPVMKEFRFCNVDREDDSVTRWVTEHVRDHLTDAEDIIYQMTICRIFNEPVTLAKLLPLNRPAEELLPVLNQMLSQDQKLFRGAYMMPSHGTAGKGLKTHEYWIRAAGEIQDMEFAHINSLKGVAKKLTSVRGIGGFLANQICTDLRHSVIGPLYTDRWHYVEFGPGTRRGLCRYVGKDLRRSSSPGRLFVDDFKQLQYDVLDDLPEFVETFKDPNNLSNCMCEYDKYMRARDLMAEGKRVIGLRTYR